MSSLATYRAMVPAHNQVPDETITTWLALAAQRHSAAAFGQVYAAAMVAWAAAHIEPQVVAGQVGMPGAVCAPPPAEMDQKAPPKSAPSMWWTLYLDYRDSRAAGAPTHVPAWR